MEPDELDASPEGSKLQVTFGVLLAWQESNCEAFRRSEPELAQPGTVPE
jgi:hypothetical protein